jgi:transcriptional regulator with XRE-family HTH domain
VTDASFGTQLRHYRQAVGLSLRQLATRVGYDHSYLSQVERGQRPGSADLARLCDRELGTGGQLTGTFERKPARSAGTATSAVRPPEPLEAAWQELVAAIGVADPADVLGDFRSVPPAALLPELVAQLQWLQARDEDAVLRSQLSILIAETLTTGGESRSARRWWWAARAAADTADESSLAALARAREVMSGLVESRPLPQLLELADEAIELTRQTPDAADVRSQVRAARALVLAELGQSERAHRALQELVGAGDELRAIPAQPIDWMPYQLHWAEGRVCARLGYGVAGCVLLERARELCPERWTGERARLDLGLSECLAVEGDVAAALALALRVLVELPDEWHNLAVYDDAARVLTVVQEKEPGRPAMAELQRLLARPAYLSGRSVGSGSWGGVGRG